MLPKDPAAFNELLLLNRALLINIFESKPSEYRFEAQRKLYQQLQDIYNQLVDNDFKKDVAEMLTLKGSDQLLASVAPASGIRIELHSLSERIGQLRSKINTHSRYKRVSLANCHKDGDATTEKSNGANISLVESMMETFLETKADGTTSSNMTDSELGDLMIKFEEDYDDDLLPMASSADNNNTEASSRPTCAVNSHSSPVAPPAKAKRPASSMIPSARSQKQAKVDAMSKETTLQPNVNSNRKMVNRQSPVRYIYTSNDNGLARSMLESQPSSSAAAAASTFSGNYVPIAPKPVVGTSSTSTGTSNSLPSYPNPTITNVPISNPIPVPVKLPPNKKLKVIMVGSKPAGVILNGRPMLAMVDTVGNILCAPTKVTTGMTFVSMTDLPKLVKSTNPPNIAKAITQPPVKQVVANISQPSKPSTSKQGSSSPPPKSTNNKSTVATKKVLPIIRSEIKNKAKGTVETVYETINGQRVISCLRKDDRIVGFRCPQRGCAFLSWKVDLIYDHMQSVHGKSMPPEQRIYFNSSGQLVMMPRGNNPQQPPAPSQ